MKRQPTVPFGRCTERRQGKSMVAQYFLGSKEIAERVVKGSFRASLVGPTINDEGSAASQSASYLSGAADDVYLQAASYSYSPMRFNVRGYEQRESSTYINGLNFNDLERGRFNYSSLGGLNNAMRNKDAVNGLEMPGYAYGSLGGTTNINTRATNYAAGTTRSHVINNHSLRFITSKGLIITVFMFTTLFPLLSRGRKGICKLKDYFPLYKLLRWEYLLQSC